MADKTAVAQADLTLSRDLGAGNTESYSVGAGESFDFSALPQYEQDSLKERDLVKFEVSDSDEKPADGDEELTRDEAAQLAPIGEAAGEPDASEDVKAANEDPQHSDEEDVLAAASADEDDE
jgi:hypothetical protein